MFSTILLPIDLAHEETQLKATAVAVGMAKESGGTLHIMTVLPDFKVSVADAYFPEDLERKAHEGAENSLRDFAARNVGTEVNVELIVTSGSIYREILQHANAITCDLIVMASHRPELKDYLLGPNAARVVRHATQSVLVIRQ